MKSYVTKPHRPGLKYDYINGKWTKRPMPPLPRHEPAEEKAPFKENSLKSRLKQIYDEQTAMDEEVNKTLSYLQEDETPDVESTFEKRIKDMAAKSWANVDKSREKSPMNTNLLLKKLSDIMRNNTEHDLKVNKALNIPEDSNDDRKPSAAALIIQIAGIIVALAVLFSN